MKKGLLLIITIMTITVASLAGCTQIEDEISKEEAQQLVIQEHSGNIGNVEITSI